MTPAQRAALLPTDPEYDMRVIGSKIQVAGWASYATLMLALKLAMLFFYLRLTVPIPLRSRNDCSEAHWLAERSWSSLSPARAYWVRHRHCRLPRLGAIHLCVLSSVPPLLADPPRPEQLVRGCRVPASGVDLLRRKYFERPVSHHDTHPVALGFASATRGKDCLDPGALRWYLCSRLRHSQDGLYPFGTSCHLPSCPWRHRPPRLTTHHGT